MKVINVSNKIDKNNYFDSYIKELYKINTDNPQKAKDIAKKGLNELGLLDKSAKTNKLGIDMKWAVIICICFLIILCAFFSSNLELAMMYIFGVVFFLAGLFIGLYVPIFGIIFLFSHGGAGIYMMLSSLLGNVDDFSTKIDLIFNNPIYTDGGMPITIKLYLIIILVVFVVAFIYTILHNLSPKLKENKIHTILVLSLYLLLIILVGFLPRIFPFLFL
jgi:hypothetical protein